MPLLSLEETDKAGYDLSKLSDYLSALGEFIQHQDTDPCHSQDTFYGMGGLIINLAGQVKEVSETLLYGPEQPPSIDDDEEGNTDEESEEKEPSPFHLMMVEFTEFLKARCEATATDKMLKREASTKTGPSSSPPPKENQEPEGSVDVEKE
ncbi:MAG: hypothetical protein R3B45_07750 [Bdellovibrionota bacterium]